MYHAHARRRLGRAHALLSTMLTKDRCSRAYIPSATAMLITLTKYLFSLHVTTTDEKPVKKKPNQDSQGGRPAPVTEDCTIL